MAFLSFHEQIRNDEHCPICRRYYITLCKTFDEAYEISYKTMEFGENM